MKAKKSFPKDIELKNGRVFVQRDFYDITEVLDSMGEKLKLNEKKKDFNIMLYWKKFIRENTSDMIADNTFAHRFTKERKLVIGVKSAVIANELHFIRAIIEKEFIKEVQEYDREIKGIVFELRS